MVRFTVHNLGEHIIDNLQVSGPAKDIISSMAEMFLAGYSGPPNADLDFHFAEYVIKFSYGQGEILEYRPSPPQPTH